jgi:DnaK suppressor protein
MNKQTIQGCARVLEAKRGELLSSQHKTENIIVERVPDLMEELDLEVQRSIAVDALSRRSALLSQVTEALQRIASGKYGMCQACRKAISPKRLAALPWAALCLECQEAAEHGPEVGASISPALKLEDSPSSEGGQPAKSSFEPDRRLRRPAIPRPSRNGGAVRPEARL